MKATKLLVSVVMMLALTCCVKSRDDRRAADFERYIIEQAEKRAYLLSTKEAKINFVTSRYKHGKEFDEWMNDIRSEREEILDELHDYCKVIHKLDHDAGRQLPFEKAVRIVMERADTSSRPDDVV